MSEQPTRTGVWPVPKTHLFISYAHKDKADRDQLVAHLATLVREGIVSSWEDRMITPGQDWSEAIHENLAQADIFVVLASADFLASDYCTGIELKKGLERQATGRSVLVPVIVRPCTLAASPLASLEALPDKANPVSEWKNRDRAWTNVVEGVLKVAALVESRKITYLDKFVPAILTSFYKRRAHLVDLELNVEFAADGTYVHPRSDPIQFETVVRNVQRLRKRQPELGQRLEAYFERLGESRQQAQDDIWQLYDALFAWNGSLDFILNTMLHEPLETLGGLLEEEFQIYLQLLASELEGSLFGLPPESDLKADMREALEAQSENINELAKGMGQISKVLEEVRKIGEREASDEFEDPE